MPRFSFELGVNPVGAENESKNFIEFLLNDYRIYGAIILILIGIILFLCVGSKTKKQ